MAITPNVSGNYGVHIVETDGALSVHVVPSDGVRPVVRLDYPATGPASTTSFPAGTGHDPTVDAVITELQTASRLTSKYAERADKARRTAERDAKHALRESLTTQLAVVDADIADDAPI